MRAVSPGKGITGKSILIVGTYYRPEATGIAPYTTAMAEHLASLGARVTALTGIPHYPQWRVAPKYARRLRSNERVAGVLVRRLRTYIPTRQSALRRSLYEASFATQSLFVPGLEQPDAVIGVIPTLASGFAAAFHAARSHAPLGLVVQDLSGPAARQSGMPGAGGRVARGTAGAEASLLRRARHIGVVSEGFIDYMTGAGVRPECISCLPNWSRLPPPTLSRAEARRELGWPLDRPVLLHAGNMGLKQGLEHLIEAARHAVSVRPDARFVLMGDGSQRRSLQARAAGLDNLVFAAPRHGRDYPNALAAADVLLVNELASVLDMSLPSKLTSYFASGRPVLAAVAPEGVTATEIRRSGGGVVSPAEDAEALVEALGRMLEDQELRETLGRAGRDYAATHLTADAALARVERFVADLIASSG